MLQKIAKIIVVLTLISLNFSAPLFAQNNIKQPTIKVGWIGAMTGPAAKWGTYKSTQLALKEVNEQGGINGRPLEILFEDTGCNGKNAVSAFKKLTSADQVKFILGGHCSPDSLAFAQLAEKMKIVSIAAITSSPKLSDQGDYIFRLTPVSTKLADIVAPYAYEKLKLKNITTIYELTDYVLPVAEKLEANFKQLGAKIVSSNAFNPGETDFKTLLIKASKNSDAIYLGVQAPDTALLIMKQVKELGLKQVILGNEQFAGALLSSVRAEDKASLEGVVFAEPVCDLNSPEIARFSQKYKQTYKVEAIPFGCYTGESFDSVHLLVNALKNCGENGECVKNYLYGVQNYSGASGIVSFNSKGDVEKEYALKKIVSSKIEELQ